MSSYKYCIVPMCKNTSITTPTKVFLNVPHNKRERVKWCRVVKRDVKKYPLSEKTSRNVCEDHFNLEKDMANYTEWKLVKNERNVRLRLKKGVLPHKFECQRREGDGDPQEPPLEGGTRTRGGPPSCAVLGCPNEKPETRIKGVSFHAFPRNLFSRSQWISTCGRPQKWYPSSRAHVCSNHFSEDQLDRGTDPPTLKEDACPNVFLAPPPSSYSWHPDYKKRFSPPPTDLPTDDAEHLPLEPEVVIKEEPIDIDEGPCPSTSSAACEFILPSAAQPSWTTSTLTSASPLTPALGRAFSLFLGTATNGDGSDSKKVTLTASSTETSASSALEKRPVGEESSAERAKDNFDVYGEYIAATLRKLDWKSCAYAQKAIGEILFDAEMGKYK